MRAPLALLDEYLDAPKCELISTRALISQLAEQGTELPEYVRREFEDHLKCGHLEYDFLRVRCDTCHDERLVAFSCKRRAFCPSCGARRTYLEMGENAKERAAPIWM